jgi:hypothetical protein
LGAISSSTRAEAACEQFQLEDMQKAAQRHIEKNIKLVERLCEHLVAGLYEED